VLAAEPEVAEGERPSGQRVVVIEFPDMERLKVWYDSPEYTPARDIARTALRRRLLFAEGVQAPSSMEATVRRFYGGLTTGDTSIADEVLAPDWEDIPLMPGMAAGREGYKQTVSFVRGAFPDLDVTIQDVVASGDRVAVRSVVRGTHKADFLGVAATGRQVEFAAFDFHRLEGGRIAQSWHLEDFFGLVNQLKG
ncbi:ester cyclase, partial [Actinomadura adrarensis]